MKKAFPTLCPRPNNVSLLWDTLHLPKASRTFLIYLSANIGLAVQRSCPALPILRMLQGAGDSAKSHLVSRLTES